MHDFRDIFVEKSLKDVRAFFKDYNFHELSTPEFPAADLVFAWEGTIICEGERTEIIVGFPLGFPDELPKIYLTKDFKHSNIPHVDNNNFLCTFDTDGIDFFTENVSGIIEAVIAKARDIISDGISGKNQRDFEAEFLAYWSIGCSPIKIYSIFKPEGNKSEILLGQISVSEKSISWIAGDDEKQIKSYVRRLNNNSRIIKYEKCLYLQLPIIPVPPFPEHNIEVFNLLNKIDSSYEEAVLTFLKDNEYKGVVIFSVVIDKSHALAAWRHPKPRDILKHGFRPGRIDDKTLKDRLAILKIERLNIQRLDGDRIQRRIGNKNETLKLKKICIVGCGSIGSQVIFNLAKSGIEEFTIIDYDILKPENVARHLCGVIEINETKVSAISDIIGAHFPHIIINIYDEKFHKILLDNPEAILKNDMIVCATGVTAIERRLNYIQLSSADCPPILYTWIEPFGIGSHAVLIVDPRKGCFNCCLDQENLKYIYTIAELSNAELGLQREAGCQSTFTPYSALEGDMAASFASRLGLAYLNNEVKQNIAYVWVGDLGLTNNLNLSINHLYNDKKSFSLEKFPIIKDEGCAYCK